MPDDRRIIIYLARWVPPQKFKLGGGRPAFLASRQNDTRSSAVTLHDCIIARESLDIHIRILRRFFLSLARPFFPPLSVFLSLLTESARTSLFTRRAMFLLLPVVFREADLSPPIVELLYVAILNRMHKNVRRFLSCINSIRRSAIHHFSIPNTSGVILCSHVKYMTLSY